MVVLGRVREVAAPIPNEGRAGDVRSVTSPTGLLLRICGVLDGAGHRTRSPSPGDALDLGASPPSSSPHPWTHVRDGRPL